MMQMPFYYITWFISFSDEGKAGVGCVLEYFGKCPHLMSGDDDSGIYDTIAKIKFIGNVNNYCDIWKGICLSSLIVN